jgi:hypothetical protein
MAGLDLAIPAVLSLRATASFAQPVGMAGSSAAMTMVEGREFVA